MSPIKDLRLPAPGALPDEKTGKQMQSLLEYVRDCKQDKDDLWAFMGFAMGRGRLSKAQLFQDLWALWINDARERGFFVEFGATDGQYLSNTWYLEKVMGWKGILAEPGPKYRQSLKANRSCAISEKCVHSSSGRTVDFLAVKEAEFSRVSEINPGDNKEDRRQNHEVVPVQTISLNDLLHQNGAPRHFEFLSIDTEGSEFEILGALDFDRWRPRAICVEHNFTPLREKLLELLTGHGYRRMWAGFSRFDDWYVLD